MPIQIKVLDHFDTSVIDRLRCGTRILLFGHEAKKVQICSLLTNYSHKSLDCNFVGGQQSLFSLFQTEGYGSKTARIGLSQLYICMN